MITKWRKKNLNLSENYLKCAYRLYSNACTWHASVDLTLLYGLSTNLIVQSQNGLRHATDVWQDWFRIFTIHKTTDNMSRRATQHSTVDWAYSKTQTLLATLRTQNQLRGWIICISWKLNICSCVMDAQEANVSIPQFYRIWNYFVGWKTTNGCSSRLRSLGCGHSNKNQISHPNQLVSGNRNEQCTRNVDQLSNVNHVSTNIHSSQAESQLYIFEDNEAVIKMIIKGRSPTMRHVSRTHRVAIDWLFDRINVDSKIQIKCWFHKRLMEPFVLFVEHHEILDVLLQPFQSFSFWPSQEPESHVKKRPRTGFQRRFTDGKAKAYKSHRGKGKTHESSVSQVKFSVGCEQLCARIEQSRELVKSDGRQTHQQRSCRAFSSFETGKRSKHWGLRTGHSRHVLRLHLCQETDTNRDHKKRQRWNFATWRSQIASIWQRSSNSHNKSWASKQDTRPLGLKQRRPISWCDCLCLHRWMWRSISVWTTRRTWKPCSTWISSKFRVSSIPRRNWYWIIPKRFWMWRRSTVHHFFGRDAVSSRPGHTMDESRSASLLRFRAVSWKDVSYFRNKRKMGRSSGRIQNVLRDDRISWNQRRSNWIRAEYFPRIYNIGNSSKDRGRLAEEEHRTQALHRSNHLHVDV